MSHKFEKVLPWICLGVILIVTPLLFMKWPRQRITIRGGPTNGSGINGETYFVTNYGDLTNVRPPRQPRDGAPLSTNWIVDTNVFVSINHLYSTNALEWTGYDYGTQFLTIYTSNRYIAMISGYPLVQFTDQEWRLITNYYDRATNFTSWDFSGPTNRTPK